MTIVPYVPYQTIVKGVYYSYQGKIWEALKNYAKSPLPKNNTIWKEYIAPAPDPRDIRIKEYEALLNTQITKTVKLPVAPYKILDMIAYIIMQQNNTGGDTEPEPVPNVAPTANAGIDKAITLPDNSVVLTGTGSDTDGSVVSYFWMQQSGPALANFINTNTANATATFNQAGTYVFILTVADDKGLTATDTITVLVNPAIVVPNQGPSANAGIDNTITLPNSTIQLNGVATDSDGVIAAYNWVQTIGPNTANISNPAIPNPTISNLIAGTYTFQLTATDDDGATANDTVIITVNPEPVEGEGINLTAIPYAPAPSGLTIPGTTEPAPTVYADNSPPLALDVEIANKYFNRVNETLNASFAYYDAESSAPGTHLYRWFKRSRNGNEVIVSGATTANYKLLQTDFNYGFAVEVTPVSSDGQIGIPVKSAYTDYVVNADPVFTKANLNWVGVSGAITSSTSVIRTSSAADGKAHSSQGFTGKGYAQIHNALPGTFTGFGGGKKNSGNYGITFGMEFAMQLHSDKAETWETGGRTHTQPGPIYANAYWRVIRDTDYDANGISIPNTWKMYFAYCPVINGVYRKVKKSTQTINGTTVIGLDFLINGGFVAGQGFDSLEIAGESIVNM